MYIIQPHRPVQDSHIIALTLKMALYSVKRYGSTGAHAKTELENFGDSSNSVPE